MNTSPVFFGLTKTNNEPDKPFQVSFLGQRIEWRGREGDLKIFLTQILSPVSDRLPSLEGVQGFL